MKDPELTRGETLTNMVVRFSRTSPRKLLFAFSWTWTLSPLLIATYRKRCLLAWSADVPGVQCVISRTFWVKSRFIDTSAWISKFLTVWMSFFYFNDSVNFSCTGAPSFRGLTDISVKYQYWLEVRLKHSIAVFSCTWTTASNSLWRQHSLHAYLVTVILWPMTYWSNIPLKHFPFKRQWTACSIWDDSHAAN